LNLIRADQVLTRDAKARRGDLLDRAATRVAIRIRDITGRIFAALAGIASAANTVHGDSERFMRFPY